MAYNKDLSETPMGEMSGKNAFRTNISEKKTTFRTMFLTTDALIN